MGLGVDLAIARSTPFAPSEEIARVPALLQKVSKKGPFRGAP